MSRGMTALGKPDLRGLLPLTNLSVMSYAAGPGSLADVLERALALGSPNFSRPFKVKAQGLVMCDSGNLPIVVLIGYAPGPGPGVGSINGGRVPEPKPISGGWMKYDVLSNASMIVRFGKNVSPLFNVATPPSTFPDPPSVVLVFGAMTECVKRAKHEGRGRYTVRRRGPLQLQRTTRPFVVIFFW